MIARFGMLVLVAAVVAGVACVDMSAPKGAASISVLQMPQPAVVIGDTLRDSTGAVVKLDVISYDAAGNPISGITPSFFITDTLRRAHLTGGTRILVGDSIGLLQIVGQVGTLQTPAVSVHVTFAPNTIAKIGGDSVLVAKFGGDSSSSLGSVPLKASLLAANDSAVQGFLVHYSLLRAPATRTDKKSPAVFLANSSGQAGTVDTTTASGTSRQLVVVSAFLADPALLAGTKTDTAIVQATIVYKDTLVKGAPITWTIPIRVGTP